MFFQQGVSGAGCSRPNTRAPRRAGRAQPEARRSAGARLVRRRLRHRPRGARGHARLLPIGHGAVSRSCPDTSRREPSSPSARASPDFDEGDRVVVECIQGCGECPRCRATRPSAVASGSEVGVMGHDGACAAYLVTRARYVHRVPDSVTLAQAALAEPLAVVHKALRRLGSKPQGDRPRRCAVVGAGTIGHLTAQVLALRGHAVTVFDRERDRLSLLNGPSATSTDTGDLERVRMADRGDGAAERAVDPAPAIVDRARQCCCSACRTRPAVQLRVARRVRSADRRVGRQQRRRFRSGARHAAADRHDAVPGRVLSTRGVREGVERRSVAERAQGDAESGRDCRI